MSSFVGYGCSTREGWKKKLISKSFPCSVDGTTPVNPDAMLKNCELIVRVIFWFAFALRRFAISTPRRLAMKLRITGWRSFDGSAAPLLLLLLLLSLSPSATSNMRGKTTLR
jgi:hypothetical protein